MKKRKRKERRNGKKRKEGLKEVRGKDGRKLFHYNLQQDF